VWSVVQVRLELPVWMGCQANGACLVSADIPVTSEHVVYGCAFASIEVNAVIIEIQ